jgi:hypothetical protein
MRALSLPVHLALTLGHEAGEGRLVKNPIRNETSLILVVAVVFSAVAIPVLSGFLEPSQPPAVAAVQIGEPRDDGGDAERASGAPDPDPQPEPETRDPRSAGGVQAERRRSAPRPADPARSAPADDAAEDDPGED